MTAAIVVAYGLVSLCVWVYVGARTLAEMARPEHAEHFRHVDACQFCQRPRWFWNGYSCGGGTIRRTGSDVYPRSWSPWFRLHAALGWPVLLVAVPAHRAQSRLTEHFAARFAAQHQQEIDIAEVDRILAALPPTGTTDNG